MRLAGILIILIFQNEITIKNILQYIKGTRDKGLFLKSANVLNMDFYVESEFSGLWHVENPTEYIIIKSCSEYAIALSRCPMIWASKLHQMVALSTNERE